MTNLALLGATGSIGESTIDVVRSYPEKFKLQSFTFRKNVQKGRNLIKEFSPIYVGVEDETTARLLKNEFPKVEFGWGVEGLIEAASLSEVDTVLTAVSGSVGLLPTLAAIKEGKKIALANKETLVMGGQLVINALKNSDSILLPVDSEHSAIFQCLEGQKDENVDQLLITASGGSFRDYKRNELEGVTLQQALAHPNWSMGKKITIDSATMANKGLEVIEAHWLFNIKYDKIKVILHRESIVHSMVVMKDGAYMAQLGASDMREPIQYALTFPSRLEIKDPKSFDLTKIEQLRFEKLDFIRFPMVKLAYDVGIAGDTYPTVYNAANEIAVDAFLNEKISFLQIESLVERAVEEHKPHLVKDIETLLELDKQTRTRVAEWIKK